MVRDPRCCWLDDATRTNWPGRYELAAIAMAIAKSLGAAIADELSPH